MKKNPKQNTEDQLDLLQKEVNQLQIKVFNEIKKKWYKNPSLILSIVAVISSLFFSVNSFFDKQEKELIQKESSKLISIIESINSLMNEEEKLMQITSSQYSDNTAKNNAYLSFGSKSGYLLDKISTSIDTININKLEPNLLLNYGRFLSNNGKYKESNIIYNKVIEKSKDSLTLGISYRSLANISANQSYTNSDSLKSREYRKKDIKLAETFSGEAQNNYLSRSFELWALDEYYLLKNIKEGNRLIDSAKFYVNQFPDMNQNKSINLNRLNEIYNFYNNILIPSKMAGEYDFYSNDGRQGRVYISTNSNGSNINIDFIKNDKLYGRLSGIGNLINLNELKYTVQIELVNDFNQSRIFGGTLNLKTAKNQKLIGYLYEFGKKPVKYYLTKKPVAPI